MFLVTAEFTPYLIYLLSTSISNLGNFAFTLFDNFSISQSVVAIHKNGIILVQILNNFRNFFISFVMLLEVFFFLLQYFPF